MFEGALQRKNYNIERQSWKQTDYLSLWILWWMSTKIWQCQCLEISNRSVWLSSFDSCSWKSNFLFTWRPFSKSWHSRPGKRNRSCLWSATWRTYVWLALVWPWWQDRLGNITKRCWIYIWVGHFRLIYSKEWSKDSGKSSSVGYDRV